MSSEPIRVLQVMPAMDAGGLEPFVMHIYRPLHRARGPPPCADQPLPHSLYPRGPDRRDSCAVRPQPQHRV